MSAPVSGLLILDVPRLPTPVPGLSPAELAGRTTRSIGQALVSRSSDVEDATWRQYLHRGGEALIELGPMRNAVLHSRPATVNERQRLHRWRIDPTEVVTISLEHLHGLLDAIEVHRRALDVLRPATGA